MLPTRKVLEALWMVRQFPKQIRRDLHRYHNGLKLADWWRGTRDADGHLVLSSSELVDYLQFLDDEGAFKTAAERGGRWPDWKRMLAEGANEGYRLRSSYHAANTPPDSEARFDPSELFFIDPVDRAEIAENTALEERQQQQAVDEFEAQTGLSV